MATATVSDYRREHLRRLIDDHGGPTKLAAVLGYTNGSFLVQMAGPNPMRQVTEASAREYERRLGLPEGSLDKPVEIDPAFIAGTTRRGRSRMPMPPMAPAANAPISTDNLMSLIKLMGEVCSAENVTLPPMKQADIMALAIADSMEHGNEVRPEYIKTLISLTK